MAPKSCRISSETYFNLLIMYFILNTLKSIFVNTDTGIEAARLQFLQCNYDIAVLFVGKGVQTIERNRSKKIMSVRPSVSCFVRCGAEIGRYSGKKVAHYLFCRRTFTLPSPSSHHHSSAPPTHPTCLPLSRRTRGPPIFEAAAASRGRDFVLLFLFVFP